MKDLNRTQSLLTWQIHIHDTVETQPLYQEIRLQQLEEEKKSVEANTGMNQMLELFHKI